jgi:hypothetical protein
MTYLGAFGQPILAQRHLLKLPDEGGLANPTLSEYRD